jgi:pre-rRNA-processing protein TSR1
MPHHHRASSLKQKNKGHKTGKASKRSIKGQQGGKIQSSNRVNVKKNAGALSKAKADRLHIAKQRRAASREKLIQQKRSQGRLNGKQTESSVVPRIVGIVSLSDAETDLEECVKDFLIKGADKVYGADNQSSSTDVHYSKFKKEGYLTYLTNSNAFRPMYSTAENQEDSSVLAALDLCRVCDAVVFLIDGRDSHKSKGGPVSGMSIGDVGPSVTTGTSSMQQDYDHLISSRGDRVLSAIKAQGLPTPLTVLVNFEGDEDDEEKSMASYLSAKSVRRSALKQKLELRKYLTRFVSTEFGEGMCRVMELDIPEEDMECEGGKNSPVITNPKKILHPSVVNQSSDDCPTRAALTRTLCQMSAMPPKWVTDMPRAFIVSSNNGHNGGYEYNANTCELKITGFIRGKVPWNVNSLIHIPNVGTFGVKRIQMAKSLISLHQKRTGKDADMEDSSSVILAQCDEDQREPLDMFANPDVLEGEQNLIGFEDEDRNLDDEEVGKDGEFKEGFARPAGWNDYQSAWLDALKDEDNLSEEEDKIDHGELAYELNKKKSDASVITNIDIDVEDANYISAFERQQLIEQRKKAKEEELEFPDEVQVDEDVNARERFARYRSLKSFRKSYWDPKENLPETYASIFHFNSFKATQADVMADMRDLMLAADAKFRGDERADADEDMGDFDDEAEDLLMGCVAPGSFVTIVIESVSSFASNRINRSSLLTAVSLLPHENKVSVLHMGLSTTSQCDELCPDEAPIKSKDTLTFRCGWRTWRARPIFSQHNLNSDKHKFERFMPTNGAFFAASVLGPVTYTPCPILVFRQNQKNTKLVALGSMLGADADRIVVKRIVLTGYPTRVHKRHATVKYMFYNPEDVKWFKPATLFTKHGLQGNIIQSVGEHGTMKTLFNAPIKQHDTVCLHLYKRIFPKYAPIEFEDANGEKSTEKILVL